MTNQELNRDFKRLWKLYKSRANAEATKEYFDWLENKVKPELLRLYNADDTLKPLNTTSLKILIRLNLSLRVIQFHHFGNNIEIKL